jgi:hypothetical protein
MQCAASGKTGQVFWCPRCGTLRIQRPGFDVAEVCTPKLVSRCRQFGDMLEKNAESKNHWLRNDDTVHQWEALGILEAIDVNTKDRAHREIRRLATAGEA